MHSAKPADAYQCYFVRPVISTEMYADYKSLILLKYKNDCKAQRLSLSLSRPTPGSLRAECATLCKYRFDKKDQQILRNFFGQHDNQKAYIQAIEGFDIDKFKPLLNFINGKTGDTDQKNIELLAWLLDIQPRPYRNDFPYENIDPNTEPPQDESKITVDDVGLKQEVNQQPTRLGLLGAVDARNDNVTKTFLLNRRRVIVSVLIIVLITSAVIGLWRAGIPAGSCMYWAGDHYQLVACDKKMDNVLVIAAERSMLKDFKKITREDTITEKALGHIWYSKINNVVEYFTADGYHPLQVHYHLKPLTRYIIQQHIRQ
jgi:hypothetical protein